MFETWSGEKAENISELPPSGSYRIYYRIEGITKAALGVYNTDKKENNAFVEFSKQFLSKGLKVPEIYVNDEVNDVYLIEDLGNVTLYDFLMTGREGKEFPAEAVAMYKKTLSQLIRFQIEGDSGLDYGNCYPRAAFDKQSMLWDLNYFKYYFLKLAKVPFDEQNLEDDFYQFIDYLLEEEHGYFLYRDFQSRNVMVVDGEPAFIDYQGGRKGALQYDVASLLYDAKADIPESAREELLDFYISELKKYKTVDEVAFKSFYQGYVLIRIMQAMGAYGFRGLYEKKEHFLKSIPYALDNLSELLPKLTIPVELPELKAALNYLINSSELRKLGGETLTVSIKSFSYKRGIPVDVSGNGGGFVFDCRSIHNPGRYDAYKHLTGKDAEVIQFFEKEDEMSLFLEDVYSLVCRSVERYLERGFKHLAVNFGCTGGQHRSVYSAEHLTNYLQNKYPVNVQLNHVEQEMKVR